SEHRRRTGAPRTLQCPRGADTVFLSRGRTERPAGRRRAEAGDSREVKPARLGHDKNQLAFMPNESNNAAAPDLTKRPPRSPRLRLGGYVLLPRMLDKGRAEIAGQAGEYHY